jgi:putative photosynthetic complex assembly protein
MRRRIAAPWGSRHERRHPTLAGQPAQRRAVLAAGGGRRGNPADLRGGGDRRHAHQYAARPGAGHPLVTDAQTGRQVAILAPGTNGFIRATLRGLAHSGGHEEHPRENHPFRLTALSDGRLTLDDPDTHRTLDLEAFGSLNSAAFATLLIAPEPRP